ncbi:hypothetical protein [Selenomonas ruminantium]|nr:hypothetical protein [Selenomonas ruminantium]
MFIVLLPFQDTVFQNMGIGYLGQSVSNVVLLMYIILVVSYKKSYNKKRVVLLCGIPLITFIYSLLMILSYYDSSEFLLYFYRCFSGAVAVFLFFAEYYMIRDNVNILRNMLPKAWWVNFLGWFLCDILRLGFDSPIHVLAPADYPRLCGFASEASMFCFTTTTLTLLCLHYEIDKIKKIIMILFGGYVLLYGGSKGTLISFFIAILLYVVITKHVDIYKKIFLLIIFFVCSYMVFYMYLVEAFIVDFETATSFATRGSVTLLAVFLMYYFPMGTGFGRFVPEYINHITEVFDFLQGVMPVFILKYDEIEDILGRGGGKGIGIFNTFFQYLAFFGIPFLILFISYIKKAFSYIRTTRPTWISILFLFLSVSVFTFHTVNCVSIIILVVFWSEYECNANFNATERKIM